MQSYHRKVGASQPSLALPKTGMKAGLSTIISAVIPSTASSATLTFWYNITSREILSNPYDTLKKASSPFAETRLISMQARTPG